LIYAQFYVCYDTLQASVKGLVYPKMKRKLGLNLKYLKLCLTGLKRLEGESLMTSFSFLGELTL